MTVVELRARMSHREIIQWDEWLMMRREADAPEPPPDTTPDWLGHAR